MDGLIALVFTVVGGTLGAGLNQYVTHIRDRRAARASVIKHLQKIENSLIDMRWPDETKIAASNQTGNSKYFEKIIAKFESVCLIAGIPRASVVAYVSSCRVYEGARRGIAQADATIEALENAKPGFTGNAQAEKLINEVIGYCLEGKSQLSQAEEQANVLHESALELLGRSIWHPYAVLADRSSFSKIEKSASELDRGRREMTSKIREQRDLTKQLTRRTELPEAAVDDVSD